MPRVTCIDCGSEVVVDPTGRCPEGHMLGPAGSRIEHAIGTDTAYPDEPEPWTATITAEEVELPSSGSEDEADGATRVARPVQAPAPPPDADDGSVDTDSLFSELHTLAQGGDAPQHTDNGNGASPPAPPTQPPATAPSTRTVPDAPATAEATDATTDADVRAPAAPPSTASPRRDEGTAAELSDLASLEAMLQELSESPSAPTPSEPASDATGGTVAGPDAAGEATGEQRPPTPPAHARGGDGPPPPPPPGAGDSAPSPPAGDAAPSPPPEDGGLDLSNFTAKGKKVSGKGRRLRR